MATFASTPLDFTIEDNSSDWAGPFFVVVGSKDDWAGDNWWANFPTRAEAEDFIKQAQAQHPVNSILVAFRNEDGDYSAEEWLSFIEDWRGTPEQVEHARRVLGRLAQLDVLA